jgi:hypothetical protein
MEDTRSFTIRATLAKLEMMYDFKYLEVCNIRVYSGFFLSLSLSVFYFFVAMWNGNNAAV